MNGPLPLAATLQNLPPIWPEDVLPAIRAAAVHEGRKVVILDDDPTGTQTVRDLPVITRWDVAALRREFATGDSGFFILTNSRSLARDATISLHHSLAENLRIAAGGRPFSLVSRSDSTLRGHYPAETDELKAVLGPFDLTVIAPYFEAGGRLTIGNSHYVVEGGLLVPAAQTPFAADPVFGYAHSDLRDWVQEKTGGTVRAEDVVCLSLDLLRAGGPARVAQVLAACPQGATCIVNAADRRDIEVFAAGALEAEGRGRRILYRSAASFVAARLGQSPAPCLSAPEVARDTSSGGLIVAGSHVPKTTEQLVRLRERHDVVALELDVHRISVVGDRAALLATIAETMNRSLAKGSDVLIYTSRERMDIADVAAGLAFGRRVSRALVSVVRRLSRPPRYLIAKGGITSSDIATEALWVRRAWILGQLLPGVPVWQLGPESRFPGLSYVVFPGNVGSADALADAVTRLQGNSTVCVR